MPGIKYYLAIDIGASSGRHILAHMEDGRIVCEEIYRFYNGNDLLMPDGTNAGPADGRKTPKGFHRIWNTRRLFSEIINGMKRCAELGRIPVSMAIDTWAVDYVLLDGNDRPAAPCYAYRDARTAGMDEEVYKLVPEAELYAGTGIQKAIFNTIYQLTAARLKEPQTLEKARSFLMLPDYFNFLLTGRKYQEYTNATTTQLVNPVTGNWNYGLIEKLLLPADIFMEIKMPGTVVGGLLPAIREQVGYDCRVIMAASHDTASAVMSIPSDRDDVLYISSGTWSLLGCEIMEADCSMKAQKANFTNEGGYDRRFRFLKNIMGLWMIQSVRKELMGVSAGARPDGPIFRASPDGDYDYSFAHLCDRAAEETIASTVDANDSRFLAPASMIRELKAACRERGQEVPETPWQLARVIYRSLAESYRKAADELEELTGVHYDTINILGGGSNARWLNELTAEVGRRRVLAGPGEATAIGCLGAQMIADGVFDGLKDFRSCVRESFEIQEYSG